MQNKRKKTRENNINDKMTEYKSILRFSLVAILLLLGLVGGGFLNEESLFLLRLAGLILFVTYIGLSLMKIEEIEDKKKLKSAFFAGKISLFVFGITAIFISFAGRGEILDACPSEIASFIILLLMASFFPAVIFKQYNLKNE